MRIHYGMNAAQVKQDVFKKDNNKEKKNNDNVKDDIIKDDLKDDIQDDKYKCKGVEIGV